MRTKANAIRLNCLIKSASGRMGLIAEKMQSIETFEKAIIYQRSLGKEGFLTTPARWYYQQIAICKEEIELHERVFETELKQINAEKCYL